MQSNLLKRLYFYDMDNLPYKDQSLNNPGENLLFDTSRLIKPLTKAYNVNAMSETYRKDDVPFGFMIIPQMFFKYYYKSFYSSLI